MEDGTNVDEPMLPLVRPDEVAAVPALEATRDADATAEDVDTIVEVVATLGRAT